MYGGLNISCVDISLFGMRDFDLSVLALGQGKWRRNVKLCLALKSSLLLFEAELSHLSQGQATTQ